jgi:hypothetical protein
MRQSGGQRGQAAGLLPLAGIVFITVLIVTVIHFESPSHGSSAARISQRNPAQKDSAWEANGAREAIDSAKELCQRAGTRLLNDTAALQWQDASIASGAETSPGRYRVRRTVTRAGARAGSRTAVDCRIRRDGDHFQVIAVDSSGN